MQPFPAYIQMEESNTEKECAYRLVCIDHSYFKSVVYLEYAE